MQSTFISIFCFILVIGDTYAQLIRTIETSPDGTDYYLYLPTTYDGSEPYPMIVYLHGAQAMGNTISCSQGKGLPGAIKNSSNDFFDTLQMIIVAPHIKAGIDCSYADNDYEWPPTMVDEVVQDVLDNRNIDTDRVFGSGISLGAKGIWDYALAYPARLAGLIPISGSAPIDDICTLNQTAVWAFHGEADGLIPITGGSDRQGAQTVVEAINNCNPAPYLPAYLTTFEAKGHHGWDQVYDLSSGYNIYEWLLALKRNVSTNYKPIIELGPDMTLVNPSTAITIKSFSFDPNGNIANYNWTQTAGASTSFTNGQPNLTLNLGSSADTYSFNLEVTDNEGNSNMDEISIEVSNDTSMPRVTELRLYDGENSMDLGPISNNQQINSNDYDTDLLDVIATVENMNEKASVRFSVNHNRNFIAFNDNQIPADWYYSIGQENHLTFKPSDGEYTLTATAYGERNLVSPGGSYQVTFTLTENPLPISLVSFRAESVGGNIILSWATSYEHNNSHFELFQGIGTTNSMKKLAKIPKSESENTIKKYSYILQSPPCGKLYFQLLSFDFDGHVDYSKIISIANETNCDMILFPNPVINGHLTIKMKNGQDLVQMNLLNVTGEIVREYALTVQPSGEYKLSTEGLKPGVYFLQPLEAPGASVIKVVISSIN